MPYRDRNLERVTYAHLDRALKQLGFIRVPTDEFVAYRELKHNAIIALPPRRPQTVVGPTHLSTVRNTITGRGVAPEGTLERLLSQAAPKRPAVRMSLAPKKAHGQAKRQLPSRKKAALAA